MNARFLFPLLLILNCTALSAQQNLSRTLEDYRRQYLPEKVFVHTDKSIYAGGETVWAAVYLTDGQTHAPDSISGVVHLELRNPRGKLIQRRKLYPFDGHTAGDLTLPATLPPGEYQLSAYTNYQRNSGEQSIFRKPIRIVSGLTESGGVAASPPTPATGATGTGSRINLRFFPEGGDCVWGIPCRVAVVAENEAGSPVALFGYLADQNGKTLAAFRTEKSGIGSVTYTPGTDGTITAVAGADKQRFELPTPLPLGTHLTVTESADTVQLMLNGNLLTGLQGTTILLHLRGIPILERRIDAELSRGNFLLPLNTLPPGVVTATVFDAGGTPVAERLFFVPPGDTDLAIGLKQRVYGVRKPLGLEIKMPPAADAPAGGRISLSVLPAASAGGPVGDDIRSWLLLNSDLDRPVPRAAELLFAEDDHARRQKIEDYLLTREWRRFRWEELLNDQTYIPEFELEQGVYLRGRMAQYENHKAGRPGKIFLTRLENGFLQESLTDEEGYFKFGPYTFFDTLNVAVQGRFKFGKKNRLNPKINLDNNNYVHLSTFEPEGPLLPVPAPTAGATSATPYAEISRKTLTVARTYDSLIVDLQTINVTSARIDPVEAERNRRTRLYSFPDSRIIADSVPGAIAAITFLDLIRNVPGVVITGNPSGQDASIVIRGVSSFQLSSEPLLILDGMPVTLQDMVGIPPQIIEFIDILKGPMAAAFGSRGSGGVILVYTKAGGNVVIAEPGLLNTQINGYHRVREFATFDPDLPDNRNRPDYRTTLHWNANLRTDKNGIAKDDLITSDQTGKFMIIAQGLRADGTPFFGSGEFYVEE